LTIKNKKRLRNHPEAFFLFEFSIKSHQSKVARP
jgi:hypothetical protein